MPKVRGWSRDRRREGGDIVYAWQNDTDPSLGVAVYDIGPTWYNVIVDYPNGDSETIAKERRKEDARMAAVDWMRDRVEV